MQAQEKVQADDHILISPIWVFVCRIFQSLVSAIILALAAYLMHDAYLNEEGLALAIVRCAPSPICLVIVYENTIATNTQPPHHRLSSPGSSSLMPFSVRS